MKYSIMYYEFERQRYEYVDKLMGDVEFGMSNDVLPYSQGMIYMCVFKENIEMGGEYQIKIL